MGPCLKNLAFLLWLVVDLSLFSQVQGGNLKTGITPVSCIDTSDTNATIVCNSCSVSQYYVGYQTDFWRSSYAALKNITRTYFTWVKNVYWAENSTNACILFVNASVKTGFTWTNFFKEAASFNFETQYKIPSMLNFTNNFSKYSFQASLDLTLANYSIYQVNASSSVAVTISSNCQLKSISFVYNSGQAKLYASVSSSLYYRTFPVNSTLTSSFDRVWWILDSTLEQDTLEEFVSAFDPTYDKTLIGSYLTRVPNGLKFALMDNSTALPITAANFTFATEYPNKYYFSSFFGIDSLTAIFNFQKFTGTSGSLVYKRAVKIHLAGQAYDAIMSKGELLNKTNIETVSLGSYLSSAFTAAKFNTVGSKVGLMSITTLNSANLYFYWLTSDTVALRLSGYTTALGSQSVYLNIIFTESSIGLGEYFTSLNFPFSELLTYMQEILPANTESLRGALTTFDGTAMTLVLASDSIDFSSFPGFLPGEVSQDLVGNGVSFTGTLSLGTSSIAEYLKLYLDDLVTFTMSISLTSSNYTGKANIRDLPLTAATYFQNAVIYLNCYGQWTTVRHFLEGTITIPLYKYDLIVASNMTFNSPTEVELTYKSITAKNTSSSAERLSYTNMVVKARIYYNTTVKAITVTGKVSLGKGCFDSSGNYVGSSYCLYNSATFGIDFAYTINNWFSVSLSGTTLTTVFKALFGNSTSHAFEKDKNFTSLNSYLTINGDWEMYWAQKVIALKNFDAGFKLRVSILASGFTGSFEITTSPDFNSFNATVTFPSFTVADTINASNTQDAKSIVWTLRGNAATGVVETDYSTKISINSYTASVVVSPSAASIIFNISGSDYDKILSGKMNQLGSLLKYYFGAAKSISLGFNVSASNFTILYNERNISISGSNIFSEVKVSAYGFNSNKSVLSFIDAGLVASVFNYKFSLSALINFTKINASTFSPYSTVLVNNTGSSWGRMNFSSVVFNYKVFSTSALPALEASSTLTVGTGCYSSGSAVNNNCCLQGNGKIITFLDSPQKSYFYLPIASAGIGNVLRAFYGNSSYGPFEASTSFAFLKSLGTLNKWNLTYAESDLYLPNGIPQGLNFKVPVFIAGLQGALEIVPSLDFVSFSASITLPSFTVADTVKLSNSDSLSSFAWSFYGNSTANEIQTDYTTYVTVNGYQKTVLANPTNNNSIQFNVSGTDYDVVLSGKMNQLGAFLKNYIGSPASISLAFNISTTNFTIVYSSNSILISSTSSFDFPNVYVYGQNSTKTVVSYINTKYSFSVFDCLFSLNTNINFTTLNATLTTYPAVSIKPTSDSWSRINYTSVSFKNYTLTSFTLPATLEASATFTIGAQCFSSSVYVGAQFCLQGLGSLLIDTRNLLNSYFYFNVPSLGFNNLFKALYGDSANNPFESSPDYSFFNNIGNLSNWRMSYAESDKLATNTIAAKLRITVALWFSGVSGNFKLIVSSDLSTFKATIILPSFTVANTISLSNSNDSSSIIWQFTGDSTAMTLSTDFSTYVTLNNFATTVAAYPNNNYSIPFNVSTTDCEAMLSGTNQLSDFLKKYFGSTNQITFGFNVSAKNFTILYKADSIPISSFSSFAAPNLYVFGENSTNKVVSYIDTKLTFSLLKYTFNLCAKINFTAPVATLNPYSTVTVQGADDSWARIKFSSVAFITKNFTTSTLPALEATSIFSFGAGCISSSDQRGICIQGTGSIFVDLENPDTNKLTTTIASAGCTDILQAFFGDFDYYPFETEAAFSFLKNLGNLTSWKITYSTSDQLTSQTLQGLRAQANLTIADLPGSLDMVLTSDLLSFDSTITLPSLKIASTISLSNYDNPSSIIWKFKGNSISNTLEADFSTYLNINNYVTTVVANPINSYSIPFHISDINYDQILSGKMNELGAFLKNYMASFVPISLSFNVSSKNFTIRYNTDEDTLSISSGAFLSATKISVFGFASNQSVLSYIDSNLAFAVFDSNFTLGVRINFTAPVALLTPASAVNIDYKASAWGRMNFTSVIFKAQNLTDSELPLLEATSLFTIGAKCFSSASFIGSDYCMQGSGSIYVDLKNPQNTNFYFSVTSLGFSDLLQAFFGDSTNEPFVAKDTFAFFRNFGSLPNWYITYSGENQFISNNIPVVIKAKVPLSFAGASGLFELTLSSDLQAFEATINLPSFNVADTIHLSNIDNPDSIVWEFKGDSKTNTLEADFSTWLKINNYKANVVVNPIDKYSITFDISDSNYDMILSGKMNQLGPFLKNYLKKSDPISLAFNVSSQNFSIRYSSDNIAVSSKSYLVSPVLSVCLDQRSSVISKIDAQLSFLFYDFQFSVKSLITFADSTSTLITNSVLPSLLTITRTDASWDRLTFTSLQFENAMFSDFTLPPIKASSMIAIGQSCYSSKGFIGNGHCLMGSGTILIDLSNPSNSYFNFVQDYTVRFNHLFRAFFGNSTTHPFTSDEEFKSFYLLEPLKPWNVTYSESNISNLGISSGLRCFAPVDNLGGSATFELLFSKESNTYEAQIHFPSETYANQLYLAGDSNGSAVALRYFVNKDSASITSFSKNYVELFGLATYTDITLYDIGLGLKYSVCGPFHSSALTTQMDVSITFRSDTYLFFKATLSGLFVKDDNYKQFATNITSLLQSYTNAGTAIVQSFKTQLNQITSTYQELDSKRCLNVADKCKLEICTNSEFVCTIYGEKTVCNQTASSCQGGWITRCSQIQTVCDDLWPSSDLPCTGYSFACLSQETVCTGWSDTCLSYAVDNSSANCWYGQTVCRDKYTTQASSCVAECQNYESLFQQAKSDYIKAAAAYSASLATYSTQIYIQNEISDGLTLFNLSDLIISQKDTVFSSEITLTARVSVLQKTYDFSFVFDFRNLETSASRLFDLIILKLKSIQ